MDNQHRKITGYRELSAEEIALMNAIKTLGNEAMLDVITDVMAHIATQRGTTIVMSDPALRSAEQQRLDAAQPERWAAIARTHFQEGLMALTRAVAQPGFF